MDTPPLADLSRRFDMILEADVMVPMRDGVMLATDIYRPALRDRAAHGRFPVILERTPYGKATVSRGEIDAGATAPMSRAEVAAYFVSRGYVVVYQDCRGRGGSGGEFTKYLSEGADGADCIAWLRAQPWSDGKVGMMGLSYAAHTQVATACLGPEGLAAMVVDCGGFSSGYHGGMRQGGALELRQATWAFTQAKESPLALSDPLVRAALDAEDIGAWFRALPWKPGQSPLRWVPEYEEYLFEQWRNGTFGDYWTRNGIYARASYGVLAAIPQVHLSGWYDTYVSTATENFVGAKAAGADHAELIIGPWTHGDRSLTHAGDVEFGPDAAVDGTLAEHWRAFRLDWFDRYLKGEPNATRRQRPVKLFVMGGGPGTRDDAGRVRHGGFWIESATWPPAETRPMALHLRADGALTPTSPNGEEAVLRYRFDPTSPVPTIGGAFSSGAPLFFPGAYDQREAERFFGSTRPGLPLSARSDVLVFQTQPLAEDFVIAGPVTVELWVSSDAPDTDFTAKLIDEYPPSTDYPRGFAMNLTDGIIRCRYRNGWERPEPIQPGSVCPIRIELPATANLFRAGHRIRLDISSSNFPKFDVNPNSGEPESEARMARPAINGIHVGPNRPSRVLLHAAEPARLIPLRRA
jgi:hypothetical protein